MLYTNTVIYGGDPGPELRLRREEEDMKKCDDNRWDDLGTKTATENYRSGRINKKKKNFREAVVSLV